METHRERKQNVYRIYAKSYDADRRLMLGDQALATPMTFVADTLSGAIAVLDLGCGTGDLLCTLGTLVGEEACCVGIDLSQEMLVVARHKIADCRHTYAVQTDVTQPLPFANGTFDLVASLNLLQEVSAPTLVLEEVHRILKPGGSFRGVNACYAAITRREWCTRRSPDGMPGISFLPTGCRPCSSAYFPLALVISSPFRASPLRRRRVYQPLPRSRNCFGKFEISGITRKIYA
jgi:ubiquinone/menaquinone biosynthesis C-methylase UbiE